MSLFWFFRTNLEKARSADSGSEQKPRGENRAQGRMIGYWFIVGAPMLFPPLASGASGANDSSEYYALCSRDSIFCFYTDGNPSNVTELSAVDGLCKRGYPKGRPVGFDRPQVEKELNVFIEGLSLPNVILNSVKKGGKRTWVNSTRNFTINSKMKEKGELLIYVTNSSAADKIFVVCMADCRAVYKMRKGFGGSRSSLVRILGSVEACELTCDQNQYCEGFDVDESELNSCFLFLQKDIALLRKNKTTNYKIDRSVKTVLNCIGSIKMKVVAGAIAALTPENTITYLFYAFLSFGIGVIVCGVIQKRLSQGRSSD